MTWSIIAKDNATGQIAIAVATKFFAVGSRVPHIAPAIGGIATPSFWLGILMILLLSILFDLLARWVERRTLVWQTAGRRGPSTAVETTNQLPAPAPV